jgi:hypothetical protein
LGYWSDDSAEYLIRQRATAFTKIQEAIEDRIEFFASRRYSKGCDNFVEIVLFGLVWSLVRKGLFGRKSIEQVAKDFRELHSDMRPLPTGDRHCGTSIVKQSYNTGTPSLTLEEKPTV